MRHSGNAAGDYSGGAAGYYSGNAAATIAATSMVIIAATPLDEQLDYDTNNWIMITFLCPFYQCDPSAVEQRSPSIRSK